MVNTKRKWSCPHCGLKTQGFGVYSHQKACEGYKIERAKNAIDGLTGKPLEIRYEAELK